MLAVADSHGDDGKRSVEARPSEEDQDFDDADDGFCINWDLLKKADLNPLEQEQREAAAEFLFSTFHINGHAITIREQPQLGIAHQVWKASIVLAKYFATEEYFPPQADGSSWWSGKTVLELGAGTGIPGLLLARYGARVTITDLPHVVPQMEWNADHNKPPSPLEPCRAAPLAWYCLFPFLRSCSFSLLFFLLAFFLKKYHLNFLCQCSLSHSLSLKGRKKRSCNGYI
ncbi:Protein N-lysine methyltransferase METTL21A (Fragment), variant 2 [Balamuthia mandrillaris]